MKYTKYAGHMSLKGLSVKMQDKVGKITNIENDTIKIQFENEKKEEEYTINDLKNESIILIDSDKEYAMLFQARKDVIKNSESSLMNDEIGRDKMDSKIVLDQWRLTVESAMQVSNRRQTANNLFIMMLTILISGVLLSDGISNANKPLQLGVSIAVSLLGIFLCLEWMSQMEYYGDLNDVKYTAIRDMEKYLPMQVFNAEDIYFYSDYKNKRSFSEKEKQIPMIFIIVFLVIMLTAAYTLSVGVNSSNTNSTNSGTATTVTTK
ncbi:hypothetical protein [Pseudobutyrivibrio sp.]|uniref:RipA family octameric membrane protein n=1 Tax=Pseudobutyrivibrio sp. TaxID=2014367 RepID=UPI003864D3C1